MSTPENAPQPGTPQGGQNPASASPHTTPAYPPAPSTPAPTPHSANTPAPTASSASPATPGTPAAPGSPVPSSPATPGTPAAPARPTPGTPAAPAAPGSLAASAAPHPRNNFGTVALIAGIAAIVLNFISVVNQAFQYANAVSDMSILSTIQLTATVFMLVHGLLAVAAIVFGILGLSAKGRPKGMAGIGLGIGVTALCATLSTLLYSGLISALLGH